MNFLTPSDVVFPGAVGKSRAWCLELRVVASELLGFNLDLQRLG